MRFVKAPHSACNAGGHGRDAIEVMQQLIRHPLTDKGLDRFLADWRTVA